MQERKKNIPSELRLDPVSRGWVVVATGRAKRPESFKKEQKHAEELEGFCPFEDLSDQEHPVLVYSKRAKIEWKSGDSIPTGWTTISLPNKYPAFSLAGAFLTRFKGPYEVTDGIGFHEVIITRDHKRDIPDLEPALVRELVETYHQRYLALAPLSFVKYIAIFKNKGPEAGATVAHPHSQLLAIPVTDPDVQHSMEGSLEFFEKNGECVHCSMLAWDLKEGSRVVFENEDFAVVCPFASRVAFEMRIYPKAHSAYFERITEPQKDRFAEALAVMLRKTATALGDPDYNYFIHTAPADGDSHDHYHWHLEMLPRTGTWAGFELGFGIEISTIDPETAAEFLRKAK